MGRGRPAKIDPDQALHAVMLTFWEKGYDATSMSDLVEATGMAKPGLYATFGNKRELFKKSLENYAQFHGRPLAMKLMQSEKSAKDSLRALFQGMVDGFFDEETPEGCFLANSLVKSSKVEPTIKEFANNMHSFRKERILEYLQKAAMEGNLSPKNDPEMLAEYISAQAITIPVLHKTGADKESLHQFIETILTIIKD